MEKSILLTENMVGIMFELDDANIKVNTIHGAESLSSSPLNPLIVGLRVLLANQLDYILYLGHTTLSMELKEEEKVDLTEVETQGNA